MRQIGHNSTQHRQENDDMKMAKAGFIIDCEEPDTWESSK